MTRPNGSPLPQRLIPIHRANEVATIQAALARARRAYRGERGIRLHARSASHCVVLGLLQLKLVARIARYVEALPEIEQEGRAL